MLGVPSSRPSCFRGPFAGRVRARARGRARARRARSCARRRVPRRTRTGPPSASAWTPPASSPARRARARARARRASAIAGCAAATVRVASSFAVARARAARLQRGVAEARVRAEPARVPPRQTRIQRRQRLERRATRGSRDAPAVDFQHRALADGQRVSRGAFRAQRLDGRVPRRAADAETLRDLREVRRARAVEERHVRVGRRGAPRPSAEPRRRNRDCGHRRGVRHGRSSRDASAVPPLRA